MQCIIEGISHNGEGVARIDGKAVFVPFTIPGEKVSVEIIEEKSRYSRAKLIDVIEPSPDRVAPICPHYYYCGGCAYQHVNYHRQLELKRQVVTDNINRIAKIKAVVRPVKGMDNPWGYRNKVTWHLGRDIGGQFVMGYYKSGTHNLVSIERCYLISSKMQEITQKIQMTLSKIPVNENSEITIRESHPDGKSMVVFQNLADKPENSYIQELSALVDSIYAVNKNKEEHLYGMRNLSPQIDNVKFILSPRSFLQVNSEQTEKLITIIRKYLELKGNEKVLDAYCGIGTIALTLADKAGHVVGVESFASAVENAKNNVSKNNLENCEFVCGQCEKILDKLDYNFDIAVLDPPRSGCKIGTINSVIKKNPKKILYVSCNPSTLSRDLAIFAQNGYNPAEIQPLDMFPQTGHTESVARIERA